MTDELKACPNCPNIGWYQEANEDVYINPDEGVVWEQVQCEFCHTEPNSVFNVVNALRKQLAARDADLARAMRYVTGLEKSAPENNLAVARLSLALVAAKTLIERLVEAGDAVYRWNNYEDGQVWDTLVAEYRATVSKTESVRKESVE